MVLVVVATVALCVVGTIQVSKGSEVQGLSAVVAHSAKYDRAHQLMHSAHTVLTELAAKSSLKKLGKKVAQGGHGEIIFAKTDAKGKLNSVSVAIPAHQGKLRKALKVLHSLEKQIQDVKLSASELSRHWRNLRVPKAPSRLQLQAMDIKKLTREIKESPGDSPATKKAIRAIWKSARRIKRSLGAANKQTSFDKEYFDPLFQNHA